MSEAEQQANLFTFVAWAEMHIPDLHWLFHPANGGARPSFTTSTGKRFSRAGVEMKAQGVKPGVPDLWLPVAKNGYLGWAAEMKAGRNRPTAEQAAWLAHLTAQGWQTHVFYQWTDAAKSLVSYCGHNPKEFNL